jgi:hypothetical protein
MGRTPKKIRASHFEGRSRDARLASDHVIDIS